MIRSRSWPTLLVAATLVLAGTAVVAGDAAAQDTPEEGIAADSIVVGIDVAANGTATWVIQYQYRLDSPNRTRGFDRLRDRIRSDREAYVADVRSDVATTVRLAENRTGREMALANVSATAHRQTIPRDVGIVRYRFAWQGFAEANDTHVRAGDAIRGFSLGPRTELTVTAPSGYRAERVEPTPDETDGAERTWERADFAADEPTVVFERRSGRPPLAAAGVAGVTVLLVGAVAFVRRSNAVSVSIDAGASGASEGDATGGDATGAGSVDDAGTPVVDSDADTGSADASPDRNGGAGEPPEPLSNEERVLWMLEAHDGRVKQQTIARECDWSDSKTSRVVQRLDEDGRVDVFRLGRENVVSLPEVDHHDG